MEYTIVSALEYTYPDRFSYRTGSDRVDVFCARGGRACWQVLMRGLSAPEVSISFEGLPEGVSAEIYTLRSVRVERNEGIPEAERKPHWPERVAPFRVYDCLRTYDGTADVEGEAKQGGFYIALHAAEGAKAGQYALSMRLNDVAVDVSLRVYAAVVPPETLKMINGYYRKIAARYHHTTEDAPAFAELEKKYLEALRRMRQNMMYVWGVEARETAPNRWEFDFSAMLSMIRSFRDGGMRYFMLPSVGRRRSWKESTILVGNGIPAMSYEGYRYLAQYLPALKETLDANGLSDCCMMGVSDEPNDANATEYRALCGLIRRFIPDIPLADAMSYGNLFGALDVWIPLNAEYDKHRAELETLREDGGQIWHYVCCGPRGYGYINRFMDYPLLSTRYLHWGNYLYNLQGYLHWASQTYQPGQDPFEVNCPEHHNADSVCFLPAGDTHILYPGEDGPWLSMRLEMQRESAEEYELLRKLAERDKPLADEICRSVFRSFRDVEYDAHLFEQARRRLLEEMSRF